MTRTIRNGAILGVGTALLLYAGVALARIDTTLEAVDNGDCTIALLAHGGQDDDGSETLRWVITGMDDGNANTVPYNGTATVANGTVLVLHENIDMTPGGAFRLTWDTDQGPSESTRELLFSVQCDMVPPAPTPRETPPAPRPTPSPDIFLPPTDTV